MIRRGSNASESWKNLPWKKFRRNLFRLQKRVYKAVLFGDMRKAKSIQKLPTEIHRSEVTGSPSGITAKRWKEDRRNRWRKRPYL